jgi:thiol-disulfide isomerase/thioredoxin
MPIPKIALAASALAAALLAQDPTPPPPAPAPAGQPKAVEQPQDQTKQPQDKTKKVALGDKLPAGLVLRDLDGKQVELASLRDQVVVLHFWSTTCPYEEAAEPKLIALSKEFEGKGVAVFGVAANHNEIGAKPEAAAFEHQDKAQRPYQELRDHAEKNKLNHQVLVDHDGALARLLEARSTPHCFVFAKDGTLGYRGALDDDPRGRNEPNRAQYVRIAVESLLAGEPVPTSETQPYG